MRKVLGALFLFIIVCGKVFADPSWISTEAIANRVYDSTNNIINVSQGRTNTTLAGGIKNVSATGTAEVLASSTACKRVLIKASLDNTGNVFVGGSDVDKTSENGFPLDAGEVWIGTVDNLADIWIDVTVSGEGVSFSFEN